MKINSLLSHLTVISALGLLASTNASAHNIKSTEGRTAGLHSQMCQARDGYATSRMVLDVNLDARLTPAAVAFNVDDTRSYQFFTPAHLYGQDNVDHHMKMYFIKLDTSVWKAVFYVDGAQANVGTLTFSPAGDLISVVGLNQVDFAGGSLMLDMRKTTGYAAQSDIYQMKLDGRDSFSCEDKS